MTLATNSSRFSGGDVPSTSTDAVDRLRRRGDPSWDDVGTFRIIHTARLPEAVHVLHAFQKKTRATPKQDVAIAKERFAERMRKR